VSWEAALLRLEEATARLEACGLEEVGAALAARGAAVDEIRRLPVEEGASYAERLAEAFRRGETALERLRIERAALRAALAKANGDAHLMRRLRPDAGPRASLVVTG
jgi:hypothetical protein